MNHSTHILIVDDDQGIRELLCEFLQQHGFEVHVAKNGDQMRANLNAHPIDLIILDIMMPGEDGMTLCKAVRQSSQVPIIMLTAVTEDIEHILALEIGADDFINKPFNPRTLLARIKAVLRRAQGEPGAEHEDDHNHKSYSFAGWTFDAITRRLISPDQLDISLSSGEFSLLQTFLDHPEHVLSRDFLLDTTKHREASPYDRSIDIQISRLRQKIEADPKNPQLIKTVRGGGYVLAASVKRS